MNKLAHIYIFNYDITLQDSFSKDKFRAYFEKYKPKQRRQVLRTLYSYL